MQKITLSILLLFSILSFGQTASVTVTQLKVRNIEATTVNFGTNVETVNVSITANVSSSYYVGKGTIMVQLKRNSSKSTAPVLPTNGADTNFVLPNGYSNTKTFTITLSRFDFDNSGGIVYVEYRPGNSSLLSFKSSNINVTKLAEPITNNTISGNQTINEGITPNIISGSLPAGGDGGYIYEWQQKIGNDWIAILEATSVDYSPKYSFSLKNNSYRRTVKSAGVTASVSNEVTVTVIPAPALKNNTISLNGNTITGSLPTGGTGKYQYSYQLDGGEIVSFLPDKGQNLELPSYIYDEMYDAINTRYGLWITRFVTSGSQTITSTLKIPSSPKLENNTLTLNGNIITGSLPTGGTGKYQYSYQLHGGEIAFFLPDTGQNLELPSWIHDEMYEAINARYGLYISRFVTSGAQTITSTLKIPLLQNNKIVSNQSKSEGQLMIVYPNPTTQSVNFATNFSANKEIEITIFSEGLRETKSIFRGTVTPNQVVNWNFPANYPKGLYFYKMMADNKEVKSGKISFQ